MNALDPPTSCPECSAALVSVGEQDETCVGYFSSPGHDHDDNCQRRTYRCASGHRIRGSVQRTCPACNWRGKATCCGYKNGPKWTRWPEIIGQTAVVDGRDG